MRTLVLAHCRDTFFFFKQKTAYEITTGDWSSDVCSSDLRKRRYQSDEILRGCGQAELVEGALEAGKVARQERDASRLDAHGLNQPVARLAHGLKLPIARRFHMLLPDRPEKGSPCGFSTLL